MNRNGKNWTKEEERILRVCGDMYPPKELAERLGRSVGAIHNKATKMKVRCKRVFKDKSWTEKDISTLRECAQKYSTKTIAKKLGKTPCAIKHKASRLGISLRPSSWTEKDLNLLEKYKSEGLSYKEISKKLGRTPNACKCKWAYLKP